MVWCCQLRREAQAEGADVRLVGDSLEGGIELGGAGPAAVGDGDDLQLKALRHILQQLQAELVDVMQCSWTRAAIVDVREHQGKSPQAVHQDGVAPHFARDRQCSQVTLAEILCHHLNKTRGGVSN